jgi:hypothetical protein
MADSEIEMFTPTPVSMPTELMKRKLQKFFDVTPEHLEATPFSAIRVRFTHRTSNRYTDTNVTGTLQSGKRILTFRTLPRLREWLQTEGHDSWNIVQHIDTVRKQFAKQCRKLNGTLDSGPHCLLTKGKDQCARTPPCVYKYLDEVWTERFGARSEFDPCPTVWTRDGLVIDWEAEDGQYVYCNPPFKHASKWAEKALKEIQDGHVQRVVMLLPIRGSPKWFHNTVLTHACHMVFVRGGLRFVGYKTVLPTGVTLVFFEGPLVDQPSVPCSSAKIHDWD